MDYIKWIRSKVGHEQIFLNFAGACVVNGNEEILLQRRSKEKEEWGFPGGAMEIGESAQEALIREVKEETGLDVKVDEFIGAYTKFFDEYPNGDKAQTICFLFKCSVIGGALTVDNKESHDLKFYNKMDIPKLFNKQHESMLNDIIKGIRGICR